MALTLPYEHPLRNGFKVVTTQIGQSTATIYVTPGYFETLKIGLFAGRGIEVRDGANSQRVVVVSRSFANTYLKGRNALDTQLRIGRNNFQVVGIADDIQQYSGVGDIAPPSIHPTVYLPVAQLPDAFMGIHVWFSPSWVVRSRLSPGSLAAKLKSAIAAVDPMLSVANFRSMDDLRRLSTRDQRYQSALFVSVAGLALLLSVIGLYGIVTRSVTQRTREVGIRMALGADVWDSIWAILRPALAYAAAGLALGLLFSAAASHLLRHLIWGIAPDDPLTFVVSSAILVFCALIASVIPAARVTHINPVETLRYE